MMMLRSKDNLHPMSTSRTELAAAADAASRWPPNGQHFGKEHLANSKYLAT
jgi:hypothetical protein